MGNSNCCEASPDIENFKTYCMNHCSPQYTTYLIEINSEAVHSWEEHTPNTKQYIVGNWKEQQPQSGKGIIYCPDIFYYEGDIINAKATGQGKIIWPSHSIYFGSVLENKANGHGTLTFIDENIILQGEWQAGLPKNQQSMHLLNNGKKAQITFINILDRDKTMSNQTPALQIKTILVTVEYEDGIKYSGHLKSKQNCYKIEGKGKITYSDGSFFDGDFIDGKMHGNGKYFWADTGHWYEGEYKMNFKDGFGRYYFDSDNFQEGIWKAGILQLERIEQIQQ